MNAAPALRMRKRVHPARGDQLLQGGGQGRHRDVHRPREAGLGALAPHAHVCIHKLACVANALIIEYRPRQLTIQHSPHRHHAPVRTVFQRAYTTRSESTSFNLRYIYECATDVALPSIDPEPETDNVPLV